MDAPSVSEELPSAPPGPENPNTLKFSRTRTTPAESDAMESSGPSNGRSSIDSYAERPKSQSGELPDTAKAGPSGFSKLLRRRNKKKNQKPAEEQSEENENRDLPGSRDGNSAGSSTVNDDQNAPGNEAANLLVDESESDRLVLYWRRIIPLRALNVSG